MWTKGRCAPHTTAEDWSSLSKHRTQLVGNTPHEEAPVWKKPKELEPPVYTAWGRGHRVPGWVGEVVPRVTVAAWLG